MPQRGFFLLSVRDIASISKSSLLYSPDPSLVSYQPVPNPPLLNLIVCQALGCRRSLDGILCIHFRKVLKIHYQAGISIDLDSVLGSVSRMLLSAWSAMS